MPSFNNVNKVLTFEKEVPKSKNFIKKFKNRKVTNGKAFLMSNKNVLNEADTKELGAKKFKRKQARSYGQVQAAKLEENDSEKQCSKTSEIQINKKSSKLKNSNTNSSSSIGENVGKMKNSKKKLKYMKSSNNTVCQDSLEEKFNHLNESKKDKENNSFPQCSVKQGKKSKKIQNLEENSLRNFSSQAHSVKKKKNIEHHGKLHQSKSIKDTSRNNSFNQDKGNKKSSKKEKNITVSDVPLDNYKDKIMESGSEVSDNESRNSVSSFNIDSYPSDTDEETDKIAQRKQSYADNSSGDSSGDDESYHSDESHMDLESYPSDTDDDEKDKKKGFPVNAIPSEELKQREKRTIFVGNLPHNVERKDLKKWFSKFGKVECVRLRSAPISNPELPRKVAVIKKSFHENRSNIHAYVRFRSIEASNNALQANGASYKDHILRVDHSVHEGKYDPKKAVFVGNVPFAMEEDGLRSFFSDCGDINNVRIIRDKKTGIGKGFAYVNFNCTSAVPLALKLDGEILEKRDLRVKPIKYAKKTALPFRRNFSMKNKNNNFFKSPRNKQNIDKKKNKFQGEISKRKTEKIRKQKSTVEKRRETISQILTSKIKKPKDR